MKKATLQYVFVYLIAGIICYSTTKSIELSVILFIILISLTACGNLKLLFYEYQRKKRKKDNSNSNEEQ